MASLSITNISVPSLLCPLIEIKNKKRTTIFANGLYEVWTPTTSSPSAVSVNQASLAVTLNVTSGTVATGTDVSISATFTLPGGKFTGILATTKTFKWDPANKTVTLPIFPPKYSDGTTKTTPWVFGDKSKWTIQVGTQSLTYDVPLELYVLSPDIPKYLLDSGIPLQLLRLPSLLPAWMALNTPPPAGNDPWSAFVVNALFTDKHLWYDTYIGASTYSSTVNFATGSLAVQCWMELWLSDMYGIIDDTNWTKVMTRYPVNCQDTATLVQAIASLGTAGGPGRWRMIFMRPYGFINVTRLIGRHAGTDADLIADRCNNPFYMKSPPWNPKMLCPPDAVDRSSFANHWYLQLNDITGTGEKIYDACAGPELGVKPLAQYITDGIDHTAALYAPNKYPSGTERPQLPATAANVSKGPGILSYAAAVSFVRTKPTQPTVSDSLFQRMDKILNLNGELKSPFEGSPAGKNSIVTTWTFVGRGNASLECQISIWRYKTENEAKDEFSKRRSNLQGYKEDDPLRDDIYYENPQWRMLRIFVPSASNDNNFLMIVEGNVPSATVDTAVVQPIKSNVFKTPLDDNTFITQIDASTNKPAVNSKFDIVLQPSQVTKTWWRGYKVDSESSNALLLDSTVDANSENITLKMLARRAGAEKLSITLYGPNLDKAVRDVSVTIV